jgi:phytoene synthase
MRKRSAGSAELNSVLELRQRGVNADKITRQSRSNLALAFVSLGRERRRDISVFYAFCRLVDDIVDSSELDIEAKRLALAQWRSALRGPVTDEPSIAPEVRRLIDKYSLRPEMLDEIIAGVEMDLTVRRYESFEQLRVYCYRVASAVGLVSIEIFGYRNAACKEYAVQLGLALQVTNIIRDVETDLWDERIYLPLQDLARFDYSEADLQDRQYDERFLRLMEFEAARAREFFDAAARLLPPEDRRSMVAAEIMASIYRAMLERIKRDGFRVFKKQYRLGRLEKARLIARELLKSL